MAVVKLFSILDGKTTTWAPPFVAPHAGTALRMFHDIANDGQSTISKYPSDFVLYEIGTFDDQSCAVVMLSTPKSLQSGVEAKDKPQDRLPMAGMDNVNRLTQ